MADRVKYFLLGVLFLVVAGVIAYDRWNSAGEPQEVADRRDRDTGDVFDLSSAAKAASQLAVDRADDPRKPAQDAAAPIGPAQPTATPAPERVEPAPATEQPPRAEGRPEAPAPDRTHVVKKGDTLEAIAIRYYGTREGIEWIAQANRLGNRNRILQNQKLIIPARKEIAKDGGSGGAAAAKTPGAVPSRYRVKEGDGDLYAICRRFYGREGQGARVHRVMELNQLYSADVKPGTLLILPPR